MKDRGREQVELCRTIEAELKRAQIAYGDPKGDPEQASLWRISPRYFLISKRRWKGNGLSNPGLETAASDFADFYLAAHREKGVPIEPFYFRLDCTVTDKNATMVIEWNLVPVGEGGVEANRRLYTELVAMPEGYTNPFPGNIAVLASALREYGGRVAILIPKNRRNYTRDYLKIAEMLRELGVEIWVEDPLNLHRHGGALYSDHGRIETIFRVFPESVLIDEWELPNGVKVARALREGKVRVFPPFSPLESKESMAWPFSEPLFWSLPEAIWLKRVLPWTWPTNPGLLPQIGKRHFGWWEYFMGEEGKKVGFVLKPCDEFGGKGLTFSPDVEVVAWRRALGNALVAWAKGKRRNIIQKLIDLRGFPVTYLDGDGRVTTEATWRTRICVTGVWLPEGGVQIGDVDVTLCTGTRLIHQQPDCVFVPTVIERIS